MTITESISAPARRKSNRIPAASDQPAFSYDTAFQRNLGIVSPDEQQKLRNSRIALPGMGGVGGIYSHALSRLGVGNFHIADGDTFETANFNRQMGGTMETVGENKAKSVAQQIKNVNPEANVKIWPTYIDESNIDEFLSGVDLVIDGIEMFSINAHRLILRKAQEKGIPVLLAAPFGLTTAFTIFDPDGMKADDYFNWNDNQSLIDQVANFVLGLAPTGMHRKQIDLRYVNVEKCQGPSHISACLMCAAVLCTEVTRLLLDWPGKWSAPYSKQWDMETGRLKTTRLRNGNKGFLQRLKKKILLSQYYKFKGEQDKLK